MRSLRIFTMACVTALTAGCAVHAAEPARVRYADLGAGRQNGGFPLIVEFHEGDRLPVDLHFTGEMFALSPEHPAVELVAKRTFFVRIDQEGFRTSLEGKDFAVRPKAPGRFHVGFAAGPALPKLIVEVETPRHGDP